MICGFLHIDDFLYLYVCVKYVLVCICLLVSIMIDLHAYIKLTLRRILSCKDRLYAVEPFPNLRTRYMSKSASEIHANSKYS